ncbi:MAG: class II fumarate hydratase [Gammaproteobacteria bacterium]|nr:class II fumarate hydratase [Gammaproteobacteria bacterium]MDH3768110.1 class II fumarate hydratase [Gammaproteobacteria bacterium]
MSARGKSRGPVRIERDSMGELEVPEEALWAAQTQRAVENFPISGRVMPAAFIRAVGLIKWAAAGSNSDLGLLDKKIAEAIQSAAMEVAEGAHYDHFPIDVFQTGSGTSTNMNANEVISRLATERLGSKVHPNDHVNMCQSSNDVIPTAIHVSAALMIDKELLPALTHLHKTLVTKADSLDDVIKTGRTHLMDAMPVRMSQVVGAWANQISDGIARIDDTRKRLHRLAQGGTAVGTGINAHPEFGARVAKAMSQHTGVSFTQSDDLFVGIATQDTAVELSGQLRSIAVSLLKIANDLRWMNSGPLAGLSEIHLPSLQPGSSIMPGKINPVVPEAVAMVAAQVIGNDATITIGGQSGNFELNVMLPVIADNLIDSLTVLSNSSRVLADSAIAGFTVNQDAMAEVLQRNPILVTALNSVIGYDLGAATAKKAYAEGRPILDVARETTDLDEAELRRLLDPEKLTRGGIQG